jgi:23S rRNA (adenine2503-C2)-methyltransferase
VARFDLSRAEMAALLDGEPGYRVDQLWRAMYDQGLDPADTTTLPGALRTRLAAEPALAASLAPVVRSVSDDRETVKWLWELKDGRRVETVLMHYPGRTTVCVSSQAGCAMACGFCATGQAGFDRNLTTGEIVEQVVRAQREAASGTPVRRVSNVVFMGMGEPLANYDRTWAAIERLHAELGLSARHITVSTVGIVPGIRRLAAASLPVSLAVSLHAANDTDRDALVPINRRYPLPELLAACDDYSRATRRRLSFEWALIEGVNDRMSDAAELARIAKPRGAHVNLIPLNPTPGYPVRGTAAAGVAAFRVALRERGVNVTVRRTRGTDIDAACGQLRAATVLVGTPRVR